MVWSGWGRSVCLAWTGEPSEAAATRADLSLPCLLASQHPCIPHEWSLGFSRLSICPSSSPSSQGNLSPSCRTPGLGCPVCDLTHSLPRVSVHLCNLSFPLSTLPGTLVPDQCFLSCPTQLCVYLTYSFGL